jgi:nicotinamide riboside kinase
MKSRKIALVGPECSGKTTLARALAASLDAVYVPEFSRMYFHKRAYRYQASDVVAIAEGQHKLEKQMEVPSGKLLVCDTNNLVNWVWSRFSMKEAEAEVQKNYFPQEYQLHLLCAPDLPWEEDGLRENKHHLDKIFLLYRELLEENKIPYEIINGNFQERYERAVKSIQQIQAY